MNKSKNSCECSPSEQIEKGSTSALKIRWKQLTPKGETCLRCGSTEEELRKAVSVLNNSFAPLGIKVILEKEERSVTKFKNPLEANRIWINNRLVKHWLGAKVGHRPCCDVCGHNDCRTVEVQGQMYETTPAEIIIKAALSAASQLVRPRADESCCGEH